MRKIYLETSLHSRMFDTYISELCCLPFLFVPKNMPCTLCEAITMKIMLWSVNIMVVRLSHYVVTQVVLFLYYLLPSPLQQYGFHTTDLMVTDDADWAVDLVIKHKASEKCLPWLLLEFLISQFLPWFLFLLLLL